MASPFDFTCCQLSGVAATAASTRKYSVPAVSAHAKDEEVTKASAMSTDRTFQIAQDRQSSNVLVSLHIGKRDWLGVIHLFHCPSLSEHQYRMGSSAAPCPPT
jgi:hypothetical protein